MTKSSCRCSRIPGSRASLRRRSARRARPSRSSRRRRRSARRGVVAEVAAVLLDRAVDALGERRRARGRSRSAIATRRGAAPNDSSAARAAVAEATAVAIARRAAGSSTLPRAASSTAGRTSRTPPSSGSAAWSSSAIASEVSSWRRCDLVGVRRRARSSARGRARLGGGQRREPLEDRGKLEELESPRVHAGQFRAGRGAPCSRPGRCLPGDVLGEEPDLDALFLGLELHHVADRDDADAPRDSSDSTGRCRIRRSVITAMHSSIDASGPT